MKLTELCGQHILSGIETGHSAGKIDGYWTFGRSKYVKFCLDGVNYMVVEDPEDCYRSYASDLFVTEERCKTRLPPTKVHIIRETDSVINFVDDITNEIVLRVGTVDCGDWYPCCVFEWIPENLSCNRNTHNEFV